MTKIRERDIILSSNEVIKFPNSQISDSESLEITGTISIDATQIKGIEVDMTTLADGGILTYDSTSNMLIFAGGTPPTPPPSYPTRGVFSGGYSDSVGDNTPIIDYITIASTGDASNFGNMLVTRDSPSAGCSNGTNQRGTFGGGYTTVTLNTIDYVTINSAGNAQDFGDLTYSNRQLAGGSNDTNERGIEAGGSSSPVSTINYITINSIGNANSFGDLTGTKDSFDCATNGTNERGVFGPGGSTGSYDYITINSTGNATFFGNTISAAPYWMKGTSNKTNERGVFTGAYGYYTQIEYITINSEGNAQDFGDLGTARGHTGATGNGVGERGLWAGGDQFGGAAATTLIEYVTISSLGNAATFGNLYIDKTGIGACSG